MDDEYGKDYFIGDNKGQNKDIIVQQYIKVEVFEKFVEKCLDQVDLIYV
jgi:hypothetical protein